MTMLWYNDTVWKCMFLCLRRGSRSTIRFHPKVYRNLVIFISLIIVIIIITIGNVLIFHNLYGVSDRLDHQHDHHSWDSTSQESPQKCSHDNYVYTLLCNVYTLPYRLIDVLYCKLLVWYGLHFFMTQIEPDFGWFIVSVLSFRCSTM